MQKSTEPDADTSFEADYFPQSCESTLGPLPIPESDRKDVFPHNVVFQTADWVNAAIPEDSAGYDVVIAFVDFYFFLSKN
jgi:7SK snRNA methylphosphate capping enzyme